MSRRVMAPRKASASKALLLGLSCLSLSAALPTSPAGKADACWSDTSASEINQYLRSSGSGAVVRLCPKTVVYLDTPILFTAPKQEISTAGYPEDDTRAILVTGKAPDDGSRSRSSTVNYVATAIDASCRHCEKARVKNLRIEGRRSEAGAVQGGGAAVEVTDGAIVSHLQISEPRGSSAINLAPSTSKYTCSGGYIIDNEVAMVEGAGLDQWEAANLADGIVVDCKNSNVHSNLVKDASGTGILLRNSGGSEVFQNSVVTRHRAGLVGIGVEPTRDSGNGESVSITDNRIHGNTQPLTIGIALGGAAYPSVESYRIPPSSVVARNQVTSSDDTSLAYGIVVSDAKSVRLDDNTVTAHLRQGASPRCQEDIPDSTAVLHDPATTSGHFGEDLTYASIFESLLCVNPQTRNVDAADEEWQDAETAHHSDAAGGSRHWRMGKHGQGAIEALTAGWQHPQPVVGSLQVGSQALMQGAQSRMVRVAKGMGVMRSL